MKTISATKFKETCLALLEEVGPEGIVITKHGKPVARLVAFGRAPEDLIGSLEGKLLVDEDDDLLSTEVSWDAQS